MGVGRGLQELLPVECQRDAVGIPVTNSFCRARLERLDERGDGRCASLEAVSRGRTVRLGLGDDVADSDGSKAIKISDISELFFEGQLLLRRRNQRFRIVAFEKAVSFLPVTWTCPRDPLSVRSRS